MDEGFFEDARLQRDLIAEALRSEVDAVVTDHFDSITQEPQITSRIAARLENGLRDFQASGQGGSFQVKILAQELPDRGRVPKSPRAVHEKKVGADLYLVVELFAPDGRVSKGMLIQAKNRKERWNRKERDDLFPQCQAMREISKSSYVWEYSETGVRVVNAKKILDNPTKNPRHLDGHHTGRFFKDVLACNEGDPEIGFGDSDASRNHMTKMLEEFSAKTGIRVQVTKSWPEYFEYR